MTITTHYEVEEPLSANEYLCSTDEANGCIRLASFGIPGMNRYSLVWGSKEERSAVEGLILRRLSSAFGKKAYWILGWAHEASGWERISSLRYLGKLQRAGWQTLSQTGLGLGLNVVEEGELSFRYPPEHEDLVGGWFVWLGSPPSVAELARAPFEQTLRVFCQTRELHPSEQFLLGIRNIGLGIAFEAAGGSDLPGLIVIVPSDQGPDVRAAIEVSGITPSLGKRVGEVWEGK